MRLNLDKVANGWILTRNTNNTDEETYVFQSLWDLHTHLQNIERQFTHQSVIPTGEIAF